MFLNEIELARRAGRLEVLKEVARRIRFRLEHMDDAIDWRTLLLSELDWVREESEKHP